MTYRYPQYHELANALYFFRKKDAAWLERKLGLLAGKMLAANKVLGEQDTARLSPSTVDALFAVFSQYTPRREEIDEQENQADGQPERPKDRVRPDAHQEQQVRVDVQPKQRGDRLTTHAEDNGEGLRDEIRKAIGRNSGGP